MSNGVHNNTDTLPIPNPQTPPSMLNQDDVTEKAGGATGGGKGWVDPEENDSQADLWEEQNVGKS